MAPDTVSDPHQLQTTDNPVLSTGPIYVDNIARRLASFKPETRQGVDGILPTAVVSSGSAYPYYSSTSLHVQYARPYFRLTGCTLKYFPVIGRYPYMCCVFIIPFTTACYLQVMKMVAKCSTMD